MADYGATNTAVDVPKDGAKSAEKKIERFNKAKKLWDRWTQIWQDCYDYAIPNRRGFMDAAEGEDRMVDIFDETAVVGMQDFASNIAQTIMPPNMRWVDLQPGWDVAEEDMDDVREDLSGLTRKLFEVLFASNVPTEAEETMVDIGIGTGALLIEDAGPVELMRARSVPLTDIVLERGIYNRIDGYHWMIRQQRYLVEKEWPGITLTDNFRQRRDSDPYGYEKLLHSTVRSTKPGQEMHEGCLIFLDDKEIARHWEYHGHGSCPWIAARWSAGSGETYGRGPVLNILPAIRSANFVVELMLQNAEIEVAGIWQTDQPDIVNTDTIRFLAGTIIPRLPGSTGLERFPSAGNFNLTERLLEQYRYVIRRGLYVDEFTPDGRTPLSAAEIYARQAALSRRIGSPFNRLFNELVVPIITRALWIMRQNGLIRAPSLTGRALKMVPVSPLARQQRQEDVMAIQATMQDLNQFFGPQVAQMVMDVQKTALHLVRLRNTPEDLILSPDEFAQRMRTAMAQAGEMGGGVSLPAAAAGIGG